MTPEAFVETATKRLTPAEAATPTSLSGNRHGLQAGYALPETVFAAIRRESVLEGCKWDPQVGDMETLTPFPLIMQRNRWRELAGYAEQLSAEAAAAEIEVAARPELTRKLGLPRPLVAVLSSPFPPTPAAGRVMRFDFHPTTEGWRISEANSDVPGGFTEASHFTQLVAKHFPNLEPAGDPAAAWCDALTCSRGSKLRSEDPGSGEAQNSKIALVSAPGYMEDHQVIAFLARQLRERDCNAFLARPEQIIWRDHSAHLETGWHRGPLDAVIRFYQAEWLSRLPTSIGWHNFFRNGNTPVANPALAVISESKRFPLVWDELSTPLPAWRALLPETRDPREAPWQSDDGWLLKRAMCNTGDSVSLREWMRPTDWLRTRVVVSLGPGTWVAQRRFESVPIETPAGPRHVCVGVYTVNGRVAGAYTRISAKPVIDFSAGEVALLIQDDD